jgi:hypothetical protein
MHMVHVGSYLKSSIYWVARNSIAALLYSHIVSHIDCYAQEGKGFLKWGKIVWKKEMMWEKFQEEERGSRGR